MHILGATAEFERERIRERVLAGLKRGRKASGWVHEWPQHLMAEGRSVGRHSGTTFRASSRLSAVRSS